MTQFGPPNPFGPFNPNQPAAQPSWGPAPGQPQASFAPVAAPAPAPAAPAPGMEAFFLPPEEEVLARYREDATKGGGGFGNANYLKFLGPQGETRWTGVHSGYVSRVPVYILPAPQAQPGKPQASFYIEQKTHFWKSEAHPMGSAIGCGGKDKCLVCKAREIGLANPDPAVQKRAKEFGRTRTQYIYQVANLGTPQAHVGEDGKARPQILAAGHKLHKAIGDLIATFGLMKVIHPQHGRPVMVSKSKTGREERDVEYGAVGLDQQPLPAPFYALFQTLWDLNEFVRVPTIEEQMVAVQEMGLYVAMPQQAQPTAAFNPAPAQAPWASPFGQQSQFAPQAAPQQFSAPAPQQFAGFQNPVNPPPVSSGMPSAGFQFSAPAQAPQQFAPPMGPPPVPGEMAPPPVSSQPTMGGFQPNPGAPGGFQPMGQVFSQAPTLQMPPVGAPPGVGAPPPAPPVASPSGMPPMTSDTPRAISLPVQSPLPGGRERCYSKPVPSDPYCQACPEWIRSQCIQAGGVQSAAGSAEQLNHLQAQLTGQAR